MKPLPKSLFIAIIFFFSLNIQAKAQAEFIDSIRNMLVDLDSNIQHKPINQLLQQSILYCTGQSLSDSLTRSLNKLLSEDYVYSGGLQQAVSPHLITKYATFLLRIAESVAQKDMAHLGLSLIVTAREKNDPTLLEQARKILSEDSISKSYPSANRLYFLAKTYSDNYKPDSCYILFLKALSYNPNNSIEEKLLYANTLYFLAAYCYGHNKRDSAFTLFSEHLDIRKKIHGETTGEYAYWMIVTADNYTYLSKYSLAQELNFKALGLTAQILGKESSQYALCMNDISEVYYRNGEYDKAMLYATEALAIKRRIFGEQYFDNVVSLHNLATIYTRLGLYNEAIPLLQQSLEISKKYFGEKMVYAFDLQPLAEVYVYMGEYEKALPLYHRSIQIQQQLQKEEGSSGKNIYYASVLHSIASLYTILGQYDKAIGLFKQTLQIKKELNGVLNPEYTKTLNSYVVACLLKGDLQTALSLELQSLSIGRKMFGATHPNIATGLYNLADLYYQQKNFIKATETCNQALALQKKIFGETHPDVAASLDLLGNIMLQANRHQQAFQYYQFAFNIRKKTMSATHPSYLSSLYNLALVNNLKGTRQEAANLLVDADSAALLHIEQSNTSLSEHEKLIYLHKSENQFNYLPSMLYLRNTSDPAAVNRLYDNQIILKGMVLTQQQQIFNNIRKSDDTAAMNVYNEWRVNKALLGQQLILSEASRPANFDSLQEATMLTEAQLSRMSASFRNFNLQRNANHITVQQQLRKNEAAVEFIRFRLFTNKWTDSIIYVALLILPEQKNTLFIPLFEEKKLQLLLRYANNSGKAAIDYLYPSRGQATNISKNLYKLVWQPLQPALRGIHTVYYSPAGLLSRLSFAAIHTNDGKLLSDVYNLRQLLCTRSLVQRNEPSASYSSASLWGDIDYENDGVINEVDSAAKIITSHNSIYPARKWSELPGTKTEIGNISAILQEKNVECKILSRQAANENAFKNLDGHSPSILHVATHGFFLSFTNYPSGAMLRNGLLLAGSNKTWAGNTHSRDDGILTAYEISHLDLSNTLLVVLSACETAKGGIEDNEGVYGLQRGFKMAGARQVLMSLWAVPDKETTELMSIFYKNLLQDHDASKALQQAQAAMKNKYPPYYWSGFVLVE
jgi:CHAT domain-containing protein